MMNPTLFVFGIDGAMPEYFFGDWLKDLPNIRSILESGCYANLNSTIPPLSITAWTSIFTGKNPADTGIFEYIYRKNHSYEDIRLITGANLKEKSLWEIASLQGKKSIISYMMLTWPIKPFNGCLISGSRTPAGDQVKSVYPDELAQELKEKIGEVFSSGSPNFRKISTKKETISELYKITLRQFEVIEYLLKNKKSDLFFCMVPTSDKMNHSFWRYMDKEHRKYEPNSEFANTLKDYYIFIDKKLGEFMKIIDPDTKIIILSDHGITRMHTRINLTDWLIKEGYMVLKKPLTEKIEFSPNLVDWTKTKLFAIGAYEGQIFINLEGREPEGIIKEEAYDALLEEIAQKLKRIKGDRGEELNTQIFKKKDYFANGKCSSIAPDMIVYFDNLHYGCNNSLIGNETLYSENTAKGSDDACHSRQGIFIMKDGKTKGNLGEISYLDIAPTILNLLGIGVPKDMKGKIIK